MSIKRYIALLMEVCVLFSLFLGCRGNMSNENKSVVEMNKSKTVNTPLNENITDSEKRTIEHHTIISLKDNPYGYFAWPSVARKPDGTIIVSSSGFRAAHICPWGKTVINISKDDGKTWSEAKVINDSPIDDRDAGIVSLGGSKLILSWFTSDTRVYNDKLKNIPEINLWNAALAEIQGWTDEMVNENLGSWIKLSDDGENWGENIKVPVTAPHGPIVLANGDILYLGKEYDGKNFSSAKRNIMAAKSKDGGKTWTKLGAVPLPEGSTQSNFHEPHAVVLPNGKIIALIRYQHSGDSNKYEHFSMFQTESDDGGLTWSMAKPTGVYGSPPHIIRHSSGALVCVYGYRKYPFGQRAMISYDEGQTWKTDIILRKDGVNSDLGYPASVELSDGSILTVYYQKPQATGKSSLYCTRWELPKQ